MNFAAVVAGAIGEREWLFRLAAADLRRDTKKLGEFRQGANLTSRRWHRLRPRSPMPIYPDRWNTRSLCPGHVELDGIPNEYRRLGSDPGEVQRFTKDCRIGLCHAEFLGDQDEVDETIDSEELEFCPLHLGRSVRHNPNRTSRHRFLTRDSLSHRRKNRFDSWKQAQAMEAVLAIPVGRNLRFAGISDTESRKKFREVIGAVRMHLDGLGDHAVEIDSFPRLDATVLRKREGPPQSRLARGGIVTEGIVEIEQNCFGPRFKWPRRHRIRMGLMS